MEWSLASVLLTSAPMSLLPVFHCLEFVFETYVCNLFLWWANRRKADIYYKLKPCCHLPVVGMQGLLVSQPWCNLLGLASIFLNFTIAVLFWEQSSVINKNYSWNLAQFLLVLVRARVCALSMPPHLPVSYSCLPWSVTYFCSRNKVHKCVCSLKSLLLFCFQFLV